YFISEVTKNIDLTYLNGHPIQRLPNNINLSFGMVDGESLMCMLDLEGIAVSTGSACSSGSVDTSHVLQAMGVAPDLAQGAVRFSLSKNTTKEEIDYVVTKLVDCVNKLRKISAMTKSQVGKED
ncbi:MAG: aminotransferase class V-fold PLP-dependent enzyme, partial [Clostridia bacterium]|nr:aminotransferase class V-fold PLP-dependent enzyme [Clostridia bacterium]